MLMMDYDGYGQGENWGVRSRRRYLVYDFKDMMLGFDAICKYSRWLQNIVFEYIHTKYQSGPIYHDHNPGMSDHIGGVDNYYSHYIYPGWQHWGQVTGNPLYRSPIYNDNGIIDVLDNRFVAFHLGLSGNPTDNLHYRFIATCQTGWGTYANPYTAKHHNVSFLLELAYKFSQPKLDGWMIKGGLGADFGRILGESQGFQLTVAKSGMLDKRKSKKRVSD